MESANFARVSLRYGSSIKQSVKGGGKSIRFVVFPVLSKKSLSTLNAKLKTRMFLWECCYVKLISPAVTIFLSSISSLSSKSRLSLLPFPFSSDCTCVASFYSSSSSSSSSSSWIHFHCDDDEATVTKALSSPLLSSLPSSHNNLSLLAAPSCCRIISTAQYSPMWESD